MGNCGEGLEELEIFLSNLYDILYKLLFWKGVVRVEIRFFGYWVLGYRRLIGKSKENCVCVGDKRLV